MNCNKKGHFFLDYNVVVWWTRSEGKVLHSPSIAFWLCAVRGFGGRAELSKLHRRWSMCIAPFQIFLFFRLSSSHTGGTILPAYFSAPVLKPNLQNNQHKDWETATACDSGSVFCFKEPVWDFRALCCLGSEGKVKHWPTPSSFTHNIYSKIKYALWVNLG